MLMSVNTLSPPPQKGKLFTLRMVWSARDLTEHPMKITSFASTFLDYTLGCRFGLSCLRSNGRLRRRRWFRSALRWSCCGTQLRSKKNLTPSPSRASASKFMASQAHMTKQRCCMTQLSLFLPAADVNLAGRVRRFCSCRSFALQALWSARCWRHYSS